MRLGSEPSRGKWALAVAVAGCAPVVEAPDGWPETGCAAGDSGDALVPYSRDRWRLQASGDVLLRVEALWPDEPDCVGAVVLAPAGLGPGVPDLDHPAVADLAARRLAVFAFDPRGRGESDGEEDQNGPTGQGDFDRLLRFVALSDGIDPTRVVVWSRSFGGALAAGALGGNPALAVRGWVDYESPAWLADDLEHSKAPFASERLQEVGEASGDADAWFLERSPAAFVGSVGVPYRRVQGWPDHALDWLAHATAMVNGATASPEIRLNGEEVSLPLSSADVRDRAIDGHVDPDGQEVVEEVLAAFDL